jgi:DNA-binding transcriptional regulator YiaG
MVLDRLATKQVVAVDLKADALDRFFAETQKLNIAAARLEIPEVDPKAIRDKQGLSQPEFACLYGLEVDTLKNWEQRRYELDAPARLLLQIIDDCPRAVIEARAKYSVWNLDIEHYYSGIFGSARMRGSARNILDTLYGKFSASAGLEVTYDTSGSVEQKNYAWIVDQSRVRATVR